jgi:hypothetical protein
VSAGRPADTWFWYDDREPMAYVYLSASSAYLYGYRLIGTKGPDLSVATDATRHHLRTHDVMVAVLSQDPAAADKAVAALAGIGVRAAPCWRQPIRRGTVEYDVTILRAVPAPLAPGKPRTAVPGGVAWSALEAHNGTAIDRAGTTARFTTPRPAWDAAAILPLGADRPPAPGGEVLSVRLTVEAGVVGVGFMTPDGREILGERLVHPKPGAPQTIELLLPAKRVDRVMFRTGHRPGAAAVTVEAAELYTLGR